MFVVTETKTGITFPVRVQPRASKNEIVGEYDGALKIKLTAPPVEGEANEALINFLAQFLKIPRKDVILVKGETARHKTIAVNGINREQFMEKIGL